MLPPFYKIIVVNNSGQDLNFDTGAINLKITAMFITPATGKLAYANLGDSDMGFDGDEDVLDGAEIIDDVEHDNTSNLYLNAIVQLEITHDEGTLADGTFDLYLSGGDATAELPHNATGYLSAEANKLTFIGSLTWEPNGLDDEVMRSNPILI